MNFEPSDLQRQLHDSLTRLLADQAGFEQRRTAASSPTGFNPQLWQKLAALGVPGLLLPERQGGFAGSADDLRVVMQACGHALLLEPVLSSAVLATTALRLAGDEAQLARWAPGLVDGSTRLAWAHDEPAARGNRSRVDTRARRLGTQWQLSGHKVLVLHGAGAQQLVVSARVAGAADDIDGRALFVVDPTAPGVRLRAHRLVDDSAAAELHLDGAPAAALGPVDDGAHMAAVIDGTLDAGIAAACADMTGAAEMAYRLAVDYLHTRRQFGRLIGENQALRHRAAEMLVSLEMCRSMAIAAAVALDRPAADDSAADLLRAPLIGGPHARSVCQQAIQLHGGIGMTEEYAVGHALRRVHVLDHLFGDVDTQAARLAAVL
jgi:pimeloyl-CoA dehydrogenase